MDKAPIRILRSEFNAEQAAIPAWLRTSLERRPLSRRLHPDRSRALTGAALLYGATPSVSVLRRKTLPGVRSFLPARSQVLAQRESALAHRQRCLELLARVVFVEDVAA